MSLIYAILDNLLLFSISRLGICVVIPLLIYIEFLIGKNLIKNIHFAPKDLSLSFSQAKTLNVIFKNKNISTKEISNIIGDTINVTRKLMISLIDMGYVTRSTNVKDRRAFCYITSQKYKRQRRYN